MTRKGNWIKPIYTIFKLLPLSASQWCGSVVGHVLFWIKGKDYRITQKNISLCFPQLNPCEQQKLIRQSLVNFMQVGFEIPVIWYRTRQWLEQHIQTVTGEEDFLSLIKENPSFIALTPHIGCWELCSYYISWHVPNFKAVYKEAKFEYLSQLMVERRTRFGQGVILANSSAPKQLLNTLKNNGAIGVLPDQDPRNNGSVEVPFFGIKVPTMTLLAKLAAKTQLPVLVFSAIRLPHGKGYALKISRFDYTGLSIEEFVQGTNKEIENLVQEAPEQYQWNYARFRQVVVY